MRLSAALPRAALILCGLLIAVSATGLPTARAAEDAPLTEAQEEAVRALIRDALVNDPSLLKEAITALQTREDEAQTAQIAAQIAAIGPALTRPEGVPVLGNPKGDVTVVEFSDYHCGYCKRAFPVLWDTIEADGNVALIVLEFPILGEESVRAARAALAAVKQDLYAPMHRALMAHKGAFTDEVIRRIATEQGADVDRLMRDMDDPAINARLGATYQMAQALGISGTPAFVIGDRLIPGAMPPDHLKALIAEARTAQ